LFAQGVHVVLGAKKISKKGRKDELGDITKSLCAGV
jgi:hypothetical protein